MKKKLLLFLAILTLVLSIFGLVACGKAGEKGEQGKDGLNGKSAYELAVENGFTGTLEEWLNQKYETLSFALNEDKKSYSVIGRGTVSDREIVIPDTYKGLPVTAVESGAFYYSGKGFIESITLGKNIITICSGAFDCCNNLKSVIIPKSVTIIEDAFDKCPKLESVYYIGTCETWNNITIIESDGMNVATIFFYSEIQPTEEGNFWHYVDGVVTEW